MRLREKITKRFDDSLDIRSFVSVQTNLAILLNLLLTKEQMLLFKLNKSHAIAHDRTIKVSKSRGINANNLEDLSDSLPFKFKLDLNQCENDSKKQ